MKSFKKELCCPLKEFEIGSRKSMWACRSASCGRWWQHEVGVAACPSRGGKYFRVE